MIGRVLERDHLRLRFLAWASVVLWLIAAGGVFVIVWCFLHYLEPKLWVHANAQETEGRRGIVGVWITLGSAAAWSIAVLAGVALLAATSSVWLVISSRRATLRHVNVRLAEISEQLRQLQASSGKAAGPSAPHE
jgi:hypothetical protein